MSARWPLDGGAFITGTTMTNVAANDADFSSGSANPSGPQWTGSMRLRGVYPADIGEALGAAKDLWLRIARQKSVRAAMWSDTATGERLLMFRFNGNAGDSECCQLLAAASSSESYLWRQDDSRGSLVNELQWQGDTLVIELTAVHRMRRWPDGDSVNWQVQAVLNRMKIMGRAL
jgi:hypothetical protein